MKIIGELKKFINRLKNKQQNQLLLELPENLYTNLIDSPKINSIINNMPQNLSKIEQAYYIYLELGKILSENPKFVFANRKIKKRYYNDEIDSNYYGICKSIAELYVSVLKRIDISADLVREDPKSPITHVDTILKIDGKNYIVNLIGDLSRIKTSRRVNNFCFDLNRDVDDPILKKANELYLKRLETYYGKIDHLTRGDIEKLDKKLGYSFFLPEVQNKDERGIYTGDTIELLKEEMNNRKLFQEYVLHNKNVSEEDELKYKLDYIFENINKMTDYQGNTNYLESIRYYLYVAKMLLSEDEISRIQVYALYNKKNLYEIISILKVKFEHDNKKDNIYYMYSEEKKKYIEKNQDELRKIIDGIHKKSLYLIDPLDTTNSQKTNKAELEL